MQWQAKRESHNTDLYEQSYNIQQAHSRNIYKKSEMHTEYQDTRQEIATERSHLKSP